MAPPRSTAFQAAAKLSSVKPPPRLAGSEMKPCSVLVATRTTHSSGNSTATTDSSITARAPQRSSGLSLTAHPRSRSPVVAAPQPPQQQLAGQQDGHDQHPHDGDG